MQLEPSFKRHSELFDSFLMVISFASKPVTVPEISEFMGCSTRTAQRYAQSLKQLGYLQILQDKRKRSFIYHATDKARKMLEPNPNIDDLGLTAYQEVSKLSNAVLTGEIIKRGNLYPPNCFVLPAPPTEAELKFRRHWAKEQQKRPSFQQSNAVLSVCLINRDSE